MDPESIEQAAALLLDARKRKYQLDSIPPAFRPMSLDEAYAIQQHLFDLLGTGSVGWFLGGTNGSKVIPAPYAAPILKGALLDSGADLSQDVFISWEVDVEFGFTFGSDVLPRETLYTIEEVVSFVASIHPTLDVVNAHFKNLKTVGWPSIIADIGTDGAVVRGKGVSNWDAASLGNLEVDLFVNETRILTGAGNTIMGNPVNALAWFVRHMSEQKRTVKAGEFVATGSCTDIYIGRLNDHIRADFGVYGIVKATLTD